MEETWKIIMLCIMFGLPMIMYLVELISDRGDRQTPPEAHRAVEPTEKLRQKRDKSGGKILGVIPDGESVPAALNAEETQDFDVRGGALVRYLGHRVHVRVPQGVTRIGRYAFTRIERKEETVEVFEGAAALPPMLRAPEEIYHDAPTRKTVVREVPHGLGFITGIDLPDSVEVIEENAFYNCSSLRRISLPQGLKAIYFDAFRGCTSLKEVRVPVQTEVSDDAFHGTKVVRVQRTDANENGI